MTSKEIRQKYLEFFKARGHQEIESAKLVLEDDPTTLFTSSGMQPLIPYLMGKEHPVGKRLVDSQPSFRAEDMDEVGDNRHTTFFEMLGNWSLGDYFKEDQLKWFYEFLTKELGIGSEKLHVTVFDGNDLIPKDEETFNIWRSLGIPEERIYYYEVKENWWSRSGPPELMPVGEIGGIDSEVFYEFTEIEHDLKYGESCHPHCDCGHFMEIGNSVFIQYRKTGDGEFEKLPQKNVDFGGGLERLVAASDADPDIFNGDLHLPIIKVLEQYSNKKYEDDQASMRVIADHMKAATFLILAGVRPANKLQGYVLRRLIRRSLVKFHQLAPQVVPMAPMRAVCDEVLKIYDGLLGVKREEQREEVFNIVTEELARFGKSLDKGLKEIEKMSEVSGKNAFDLYQTYGFPSELTEELLRQKGLEFDREEFQEEFKKHQELSRTASVGMFKGGLAGHSEVETKYHTATHLLHQALRDVLGPEVFQKGSNINQERLRFDFSFDRKMTDEEVKKTEEIINQRIKEDLKVDQMTVSLEEAKEKNAIGLFNDKYAKDVSIYGVGPGFELDPEANDQRPRAGYYSLEFCGGPHVEHTGVIGGLKIEKEEAVSQGVRRIRAVLTNSF